MSITANIQLIKSNIPHGVALVAVSKFHGAEKILEAYNSGQRIFGESRMQELSQKQALLPSDIEWHFIGHLQSNKVKTIIPYVHTIHSVDSLKLLREIEKQASVINKKIDCLLEIHIAQEDGKYGFTMEECLQFFASNEFKQLEYANIVGLMGMATNTENEVIIREEFKKLKSLFDDIKSKYFHIDYRFKEISMGMSDDYMIAIEEGSTMIRVGSSIFGYREY